jgi:hypothetical protein
MGWTMKLAGAAIVAVWLTAIATLTAAQTPGENAGPAAVAVQRLSGFETGLPEEAAMVLVGSMLIGLAAAVRRAA